MGVCPTFDDFFTVLESCEVARTQWTIVFCIMCDWFGTSRACEFAPKLAETVDVNGGGVEIVATNGGISFAHGRVAIHTSKAFRHLFGCAAGFFEFMVQI